MLPTLDVVKHPGLVSLTDLTHFMSTPTTIADVPLVEISAAENTFRVPEVQHVTTTSRDTTTIERGNQVFPDQVFDRDTLLKEVFISSTDTPFINLLGLFDPWYSYLRNNLIASYTAPFSQVNFDMIITVRIIAPGSCYGAYNVQCLCDGGNIPTTFREVDGVAQDAYPNSTQDVHGFLNVDLKNTLVFELPWEHAYDAFLLKGLTVNPSSGPGCWRMLIWSLSPIQNTLSDAVANGTIQIYGRMAPRRTFENLVYQTKHQHPASSDEKPKVSAMAGKLAGGVDLISGMFPVIKPWAVPISTGLSAVSKVASYFGYTRENAQQLPTPVVRRLTSSLANVDGQDTSEMVALSCGNTLHLDPAPGGGEHEDPSAFSSLFERWTIAEIFDLTQASTGIVDVLPVTPFIYNDSIPGRKFLTTGGYVGLPFANWRGGMEYLIYIPSSPNIQGSLQVLWDPRTSGPYTYADDPTNRLSNVIIDLKGTSRTHIKVGFSQPIPVLNSMLIPASTQLPKFQCNGSLIFRINASPTAPRVGGWAIQVIVMARPAQDMTFGVPQTKISNNLAGIYNIRDGIVYQSGAVSDVAEEVIVLAASKSYPTCDVLWGEEFGSTRALMQHFSPCLGKTGSDNEVTYELALPHYMPPPSVGTEQWTLAKYAPFNVPFTYYGWYLAPFVGVRGSTRVKIFSTVADNILGYPSPPGISPIGYVNTTTAMPDISVYDQQPIGPGFGVEYTFPPYSQIKFWRCRFVPDNNDTDPFVRWDAFTPNSGITTDELDGYFSIAAGPDITVTRFRRIPSIA